MKNFTLSLITTLLFCCSFNSAYSSVKSSGAIPEIGIVKDNTDGSAEMLLNDVISLGYTAEFLNPLDISPTLLNQYRLIILSTGRNGFACTDAAERLAIQEYMIELQGKIIIEGGHLGYIAAVFPFYYGFRNKVVMIDGWVTDFGGDLVMDATKANTNIANIPNTLPSQISIDYNYATDMDVCSNNKFTELFYGSSQHPSKVGILVAPDHDNPRVVNYFVNYSAILERNVAKDLLHNSIYNLIGKPVFVISNNTSIPDSYSLSQNYPNPFNPSTIINFDVAPEGKGNVFVSIKVFDMLGKEVGIIANESLSPGSYKADFDASSLTAGTYFYTYSADGIVIDAKKMMLLK